MSEQILDDPETGHYVKEPYRYLAAAMINQAMRDYFQPRQISFGRQVSAALWLRSEDAKFCLEAMDIFDFDVMKFLTGPKPKQLTLKKGGKHAKPVRTITGNGS